MATTTRKIRGVEDVLYSEVLTVEGKEKVYKAVLMRDHSKGSVKLNLKNITDTMISANADEIAANLKLVSDVHLLMINDGNAWKATWRETNKPDSIKFPPEDEEE